MDQIGGMECSLSRYSVVNLTKGGWRGVLVCCIQGEINPRMEVGAQDE